jgi:hypothetical protein
MTLGASPRELQIAVAAGGGQEQDTQNKENVSLST